MEDIIKQATAFMCRCYNVEGAITMTEARIKAWTTKKKTGRKNAKKVPKLCSLPPTSEVFEENVNRAHFQCAIWRRALQEPPNWASEASPTLGCSIKILRDIYIYMCVCRMSNHVESRESNTRMLKVSIGR